MPPSTPRAVDSRAGRRGALPRSRPAASAPPRRLWRLAGILAAAGAGIAAYLTVTSLRGAALVCLAGDCATVAASSYARFLGLPTAAWGLAGFAAALGASVWGGWGARVPAWLPSAFLGLAVFGVTFSAYLLWVQVAVLAAVCSWCAASDLLWAGLLLVAVLLARAPAPPG